MPVTQDSGAPFGGSLADWLDWQSGLHTHDMVLGLDRVGAVARRLAVQTTSSRCVVVAGTNGKGSCVRLLETLLQQTGYRVGAYTSPHLWHYNERVRVAGAQADDAALCRAFEAVEMARGDTPLTYFEFGTLAALWLFKQAQLDFIVLEVGLGGRLDAVNIMAAEVALITTIGLDHTAWLGDTREAIGREKAGIMRAGHPVVCGDRDLPGSVIQHAREVGAPAYCIGAAFDGDARGWQGWDGRRLQWSQSIQAHVLPDNLAAVLAVMTLLNETPDANAVIRACRQQKSLHGRCEVVADDPVTIIRDVAHNREAAQVLAQFLRDHPVDGHTHIIMGMLADKPVEAVTELLAPLADSLHAVDLTAVSDRALTSSALAGRMGHGARPGGTAGETLRRVRDTAQAGDRIVVCGSFFTVAEASHG